MHFRSPYRHTHMCAKGDYRQYGTSAKIYQGLTIKPTGCISVHNWTKYCFPVLHYNTSKANPIQRPLLIPTKLNTKTHSNTKLHSNEYKITLEYKIKLKYKITLKYKIALEYKTTHSNKKHIRIQNYTRIQNHTRIQNYTRVQNPKLQNECIQLPMYCKL